MQLNVLSDGEKHAIHSASLAVLQEVGVRVQDDGLRARMHQCGAIVDDEAGTVMLPPELVMEQVGRAPRSFTLADRAGRGLVVPAHRPYIASRLLLPKVLEYGAREPRAPVLDDIVRACQLANAFEEIDLAVGIDVPVADVEPPELANVMAIRTVLSYCLHHIVCAPTNPTEMWDWITLLQSVIDTGDLIREPVMTVEVAATSPLLLDEGSSGVLSLAVEHGLPVLTMPMPAGGGTAPVTTAGQLVQQNAEVLFLVAAAQMLRPGTPCFYGGIPCTFDLRTGIVSVAGPEFPLLVSATVEMGHLYGLPVFSETKYTDTFALDEQCGAEKVMSAFAAVASGTDVVYANGDLDIVTTLSLEQIIIDLDFVLAVERFLHPVSVDDAPQLLHDAEHRGLGRGDPKDAQMPGPRRSGEPALPQLISEFNNLSAARTQLERAHQIVQEIVSQPAATLVGDDVGARLERAFERRKQQILSGT